MPGREQDIAQARMMDIPTSGTKEPKRYISIAPESRRNITCSLGNPFEMIFCVLSSLVNRFGMIVCMPSTLRIEFDVFYWYRGRIGGVSVLHGAAFHYADGASHWGCDRF